ncbi:hypothetical protein N8I77_010684 [Diaporthe amygdali]|uniref:Uncharacterized protein n=1 Tax=Phomopsis amygdali TaxID=1214568 RepID=A0AAD9S7K6_PHOAM|nr:hypothetical protein N8I77_010684 [Diaporthe amygdali]
MSQCVSCNNQPNDNDSLGGAAHEGAVTPMVVGIIVGTVAVFVLVLCALFYCAKLENEKTRRVKAEEGLAAPPDGVAMHDGGGGGHIYGHYDAGCGAKSGSVGRRPSSATVVGREGEDAHAGAGPGVRVPEGALVGRKKGLFGWGGKKPSGRATPADNPPVTAIEMV